MSQTAQIELKSGRVQAPGVGHSWWKEPFCAATDSTGVNIPMTSITDKAVRIDADAMAVEVDAGRGLHSLPIQLNLSSFDHRITRLSS